MKREVFAIEMGHTAVKTLFKGKMHQIPFIQNALSTREEYIEFYLKKGNFFEHAMALSGVKEDDKIQLNIILPRYIQESDVQKLSKLIKNIKIKNKPLDVEYHFIGQGQSAFLDYIKNNKFSKEDLENSGFRSVIDFGWNQLQFLFFVNGKEQSNLYYKIGYGMKYLIFKVQDELRAQCSLHLTDNEAIYYLKEYAKGSKEISEYKEHIEDAIDSYLSYLFTFELDRKIQDRIEETLVVLLTGGGANVITREKIKKYLNNDFIVTLKEPECADIRGAQNVDYYLSLLENKEEDNNA